MKKFINKLHLWMAIILVAFSSCEQEYHPLSELQGTIRFGGISLEFAPVGSSGSRMTGNSTWVHVFPDSAILVFINKTTGQQSILEYNPNDFSAPYSITLPYGTYEYHSIIEGEGFSAFLPFEARGEFSLDSQSLEISLEATTEYGLVTVKDQYVEKASISDGEKETNLVKHRDGSYWFLYVKGGTATTLNIIESFQGTTIGRELDIAENRHYNFVLMLNGGAATITNLTLAVFELEEEDILLASSSKFFEENGSIKCPGAAPGEKGEVNNKVYEAVDRALLIQRKNEGAELTCVCTSLVTDMSSLFEEDRAFNQSIGYWDVSNVTDMGRMFYGAESFNQPIQNWEVSKVTNMSEMFEASNFNQPIGKWDVGNVRDMRGMFEGSRSFNQPLGNWDVSNVTDMSQMFSFATKFNQPIEDWDVGKVTDMKWMFEAARSFDQPIGNWDVSNVTDMFGMFAETQLFNQPIGDWDVKNVKNMFGMFAYSESFNLPIGNWDVSNVTNMSHMFYNNRLFNQDLSGWCVQNFLSEPELFAFGSDLIVTNHPLWGTCPD